MKHHYFILLGARLNRIAGYTLQLDGILQAAGMICKLESASTRIFVSAEIPTIVIPGCGLIIGHIFTQDGQPISQRLDIDGSTHELISCLLQNTWGDYLAILVDREDSSVITLLRDPSGAVPCVYSLADGEGFITSDIGLAVDLGLYRREVNWQAIAHGLTFPYLKTARTALQGVWELLPGCMLTCRGKNVSVHSAWSPWRFVERGIRHKDPRVAAEDIRAAVSNVVRALSTGDDRFLVELSGGLDSSIVATCLRHALLRATFCTMVMPVSGTDERPYARLVTEALRQELIPVEVRFDNDRLEFSVPRSSAVPVIGSPQNATNEAWEAAGIQHGVDSFFSGGGGDTIFCYLKTAAPAADAFRERGVMAGFAAIENLATLHRCTVFKAVRLTLKKMLRQPRAAWKEDHTLLNPACVSTVSEHHPWMDAPPGTLPGDREKIHDLIGTQLFRETALRGAKHSTHFPLLSQPVMEACLKVPTWMWIADGRNRAVARQAFADRLPQGILDRRSKGSYVDYMATIYLRNKLKMNEFLEEGQLCAHDLLDHSALAAFFAKDLAPRDLSFLRIFDLCAAENWVRQQSHDPS
ncbi:MULTISPECIES: asparagine synthase C-terminal domain-containing protein [Rhodanobacter]|uniref:asparagine synthase-related protein n=1 Tax=Rhodanobacter TaxID=75309 RepID=UPI000409C674|nr:MULTISPECIES: asparagine synthase C-terminal domain-containing protein [Rhodanobacter]KZC21245.1 asparagine synthase [Rhodanobacter denitrificans]UJJ51508.1 asparagine synthase-related protein [Rhodanobacter denitrificans]UJJ59711.1 asparagine synthase-related protein [Rhodanobacter denitrificans]UJM94253.1 asparagine synthase [Rhodanobacter denitrificans]UJM97782.1 asparagine synthase [Rhodanobacter denitrificans]